MPRPLRLLVAVTLGTVAYGCSAAPESAVDQASQTTVATPVERSSTATSSSSTSTSPSTTVAGPPVAADTPAGLAAQLVEAEHAIRSPSTPAPDVARAAHAQQVAYGRLGSREELQAEVVALVPDDVRSVVEANLRAVTALSRQARADAASYGRPPTAGPPDWTILAPPPPAQLLAIYRSAEEATGVPWQYLAAIHFVETRMGRIHGNSVAGAQGPMQFIPSTWDIYGDGGDINDNADAIHAAARMLRANGAPYDMASALHAYNPSNRYVEAVATYAELMTDERAYLGYYHWQVYYGGRLLPEGYGS